MSTTVPAAIRPVSLIFKVNNGLVARALEGLPDADLWQRPTGGNPIGWMLGHLTYSRQQLLGLMGAKWDSGLAQLFARGAPVLQDTAAYPPRRAIEDGWRTTHHLMRDAFEALSDAQLEAAAVGTALPGATTLAGQIAFLAMHESYHVGQMSYVRRLLGHSAIAG